MKDLVRDERWGPQTNQQGLSVIEWQLLAQSGRWMKRRCPKSAKPDINCRDCDVRSLAGPEPDRQVFARFKYLFLKAAARSAETICVAIGEILRTFTPNAPSISETQAMPNPKSIML
jgi:hypothetical protein